jgi:hypothetical protein
MARAPRLMPVAGLRAGAREAAPQPRRDIEQHERDRDDGPADHEQIGVATAFRRPAKVSLLIFADDVARPRSPGRSTKRSGDATAIGMRVPLAPRPHLSRSGDELAVLYDGAVWLADATVALEHGA